MTLADPHELVDANRGLVSSSVFVDDDVYETEQERIFASTWLFLGHDSQLADNGDFFTTSMGEDPVLVTRDRQGQIRAFLNSCSHRGTKLCPSNEGHLERFRCPYHGWTFGSDGSLVAAPRSKVVYGEDFAKADWGLREVAQLDTFYGLIFATWNPGAPSLSDHLGDMAYYLELMLNRMEGGVQMLGGVHRWMIDCNWKIPSENFVGDYYHVPTTHGSGIDLGFRSPIANMGHAIAAGPGHGLATEAGGAQQGTTAQSSYGEFVDGMRERVQATRGGDVNKIVPIGVGTLFPNMSFMDTVRFRSLRIWQPRGPHVTEAFSFFLVDAALPDELKEATRKQYSLGFGPSGMFEQDDGEIWSNMQKGVRGYIGRRRVLNYQMGLGREVPVADHYGSDWPGTMGDTLMTDANHRNFYRRWVELMSGTEAAVPVPTARLGAVSA